MAMSNAAKFNQGGMPNQLAASVADAIASGASQNANVQALTPLTGAFGTTSSAIADVTNAFSQTILNNNFRALEDKVNAIIAALKS